MGLFVADLTASLRTGFYEENLQEVVDALFADDKGITNCSLSTSWIVVFDVLICAANLRVLIEGLSATISKIISSNCTVRTILLAPASVLFFAKLPKILKKFNNVTLLTGIAHQYLLDVGQVAEMFYDLEYCD